MSFFKGLLLDGLEGTEADSRDNWLQVETAWLFSGAAVDEAVSEGIDVYEPEGSAGESGPGVNGPGDNE